MINKKRNNKKYNAYCETFEWNVDKERKMNNYVINVVSFQMSFTKGQNRLEFVN